MQVTLHFHGDLRRFCPDGFQCVADTVADAINLFFRQHRQAARNPDGSKRLIQIGGCLSPHVLTEPLTRDRLDICPAFCGAGGKSGGIGQIILGAVLVVAGILLFSTPFGVPLITMGASFLLGGTLALLSPSPRLDRADQVVAPTGQTPEESRYLGAAKNTTASGTRIPICYGRFKRAGHILSFDVEADPEAVLGQPPNASQRRRVGRIA